MEETKEQKLLRWFNRMKEERRYYETGLWEDIAKFVNPRRENIGQDTYSNTKGQRRGKEVYDGTPLGALNTWADGMQGFCVSEALNWFRSEMSDDDLNEQDEMKFWLQQYDKRMYLAFRKSNFYGVLPLWLRDAGSIGTATLYGEEDLVKRRMNFIAVHPREIYISENMFGEVDTVFREFEMTIRQIVEKFGENKLDESIKKEIEINPEKRYLMLHCVYPNDNVVLGSSASDGKKFHSVYMLVQGSANLPQKTTILREGGYRSNPYVVWRFRKNSDEVYGYSPAADALVEVFKLNQFGKTLVQAAQKSVTPPLNVPVEMRGNVRMTPEGYNYYEDPQRIITPVYERINYPVGIDQLERLQKSIEDKYRVEFFLMLARAEREMTAFEISERKSEKSVLMSPQVDSLFVGLKQVFDMISDSEDQLGSFRNLPELPFDIGDANINIILTGPLSQAQSHLFKMQPIRSAINELAPMATLKPEILDRVDWDEMAEEILEAANFPQKLIRTDDEVAAIRQAKAQAAQQQQMMQMTGGAAEAIPKLSKPIEKGSPMDMLVGARK